MTSKKAYLAKFLMLLTFTLINTQSNSYQLSDHSLKGSFIKTYHVKCSAEKIALIRINTQENSICLEHQNSKEPRTCLKISDQALKLSIDQLAKQSCK